MCVETIYTGTFFIFIGGNLFVFLLMALVSLIFLHLSKLITAKFFKHLSTGISSNVALRQVFFTVILSLATGFAVVP